METKQKRAERWTLRLVLSSPGLQHPLSLQHPPGLQHPPSKPYTLLSLSHTRMLNPKSPKMWSMPSCVAGHSDRGQLYLPPPRQGKPRRRPVYMLPWQSLDQVLFPMTRSNDLRLPRVLTETSRNSENPCKSDCTISNITHSGNKIDFLIIK